MPMIKNPQANLQLRQKKKYVGLHIYFIVVRTAERQVKAVRKTPFL